MSARAGGARNGTARKNLRDSLKIGAVVTKRTDRTKWMIAATHGNGGYHVLPLPLVDFSRRVYVSIDLLALEYDCS